MIGGTLTLPNGNAFQNKVSGWTCEDVHGSAMKIVAFKNAPGAKCSQRVCSDHYDDEAANRENWLTSRDAMHDVEQKKVGKHSDLDRNPRSAVL